MKTQITSARRGEITPEMEQVAQAEGIDPQKLMEQIANGKVVIPANKEHPGTRSMGIGEGLSVKVNANIGTSSDEADPQEELKKLEAAVEAHQEAYPSTLSPDGGDGPHLPGSNRGGRAQGRNRPDDSR